jgi:hypothetical protein
MSAGRLGTSISAPRFPPLAAGRDDGRTSKTGSRLQSGIRKLGAGSCAVLLALSGCGKKGPPLPPFVLVPAAVSQLTASRVGDQAVLNMTLPTQNVDASTPVSLGRVEVYGYTGRVSPPVTRFGEVASLVARIELTKEASAATTVRDELTSDDLVEGPPLPRTSTPGSAAAGAIRDDPQAPLKRYYMAVAFSDRGRPGPPSPIVELLLTPLPDAPADMRVSYDADSVTVGWAPSGGLVGFLFDRAPRPPASPLDDGPAAPAVASLPAGPTRYNVYRSLAPPSESAGGADSSPPPASSAPVNAMPVEGFTFTDPLRSDGRRYCYAVSAVRGLGPGAVEGRPSMPVCVTTVDIFPPARPTGLSPIAAEGTISLVWEANTERDLQGYVVWRGEEGSEALTRITDDVVKDTRYTDENVKPGVRYVYAITAIDGQSPQPNVSVESERVEVTAR